MHRRKPIEIFIPESEAISLVLVPSKSRQVGRKQKSAVKFIQDHTRENTDDFQIRRLNCDIPKQLHTWLYTHARSEEKYSSVTDLVIDVLGKFAKERGFNL